MNAKKVIVVFDGAFGERLTALAREYSVWIVTSQANDLVAKKLWKTIGTNITTFVPQEFADILPEVDEHHFGWNELEVFGYDLSTDVIAIMREYGDFDPQQTTTSFRFVRRENVKP